MENVTYVYQARAGAEQCEHGIESRFDCEYCEIDRLKRFCEELEQETAEQQALLFALVDEGGHELSLALPLDVRTQLLEYYRRLHPPPPRGIPMVETEELSEPPEARRARQKREVNVRYYADDGRYVELPK